MTIRIISIVPIVEEVKKVGCKKCGAQLEYTQSDVVHVPGSFGGYGEYDPYLKIDCPNCNSAIELLSPEEVRRNARNDYKHDYK